MPQCAKRNPRYTYWQSHRDCKIIHVFIQLRMPRTRKVLSPQHLQPSPDCRPSCPSACLPGSHHTPHPLLMAPHICHAHALCACHIRKNGKNKHMYFTFFCSSPARHGSTAPWPRGANGSVGLSRSISPSPLGCTVILEPLHQAHARSLAVQKL